MPEQAPSGHELIARALQRSRHWLNVAWEDFPTNRAAESPGGQAKSCDEILRHIGGCDLWMLECSHLDPKEAPVQHEQMEAASGEALFGLLGELRTYVEGRIGQLSGDDLLREPGGYPYPTCIDLWIYAAEHEFWHAGQVQALALLFQDR
ncbi:MAG: hypothetical protein ACE5R4_15025 [Armatimonadota bacterium]